MSTGTNKPNIREQRAPKMNDRRPPKIQRTCFRCNKNDTKLRIAKQRNVRMRHNLNNTDKTLNMKDPSKTESWPETIADTLGTLHETVDTNRTKLPHT